VSVIEWYAVNVARLATKKRSKKSSTELASWRWEKTRCSWSAPSSGDSMIGIILCRRLRCFSASLRAVSLATDASL
jgi:hypothetical protein